jgi:DNA-binding CsgD family transcriptional regulator
MSVSSKTQLAAREIADTAGKQADRFGAPLPRARALRTLAVLDPATAVEPLEEAARLLADAPNRLELAHVLAELGGALVRRGGRDGREQLSDALALADECGATSLRTAVARQLDPHPRPRRVDVLDPSRQRVVRLAADGCSDADIAYQMVLDLDTVTTLRRESQAILGAQSRTELRRVLDRR